MELIQLRYFQVAARYEHITRAAEELNISQPALSTMISRLEHELGMSLFDRSGRSIVLNQNGRLFLRRTNRILTEVDDAQRELKDLSEEGDNVISFAVSSSQFLQGMHTFIHENPDYRLQQRVLDNKEITTMLQYGQIDLAVTSPGIYGDEFSSTLLLRDTFKLAVHKDNPIARHSSIRLADVANEPFIMLLRGLPFRVQTDRIFADLGITPHYTMECDHLLRRELINENAGISIASQSASFRHLYNSNICFLDLEDVHHTRDIVLVSRKDRYLSKATRKFIVYLKGKFSPKPDQLPADGNLAEEDFPKS